MKRKEINTIAMSNWAEEDQPREKLVKLGAKNVSDSELLSILIGSGNRNYSALAIAKILVNQCDGKIENLSTKTLKDLMQVKGVGQAKAVTILSAIELGKRAMKYKTQKRQKITSSLLAYECIRGKLEDLKHEEFWVIHLNTGAKVIDVERISTGGVSSTVVDAKLIFSSVLSKLSTSIILAHNHPSGEIIPSQQDINLTNKLKSAGKYLDVKVVDHLIIGKDKYFSFLDEGYLN